MPEKNKKIEIASAIVGGIYAAVHVVVAVILIMSVATSGGINTEGMGIVALFLYAVMVFAVAVTVVATAFAIWCLISVISAARAEDLPKVRIIAIITCIVLAFRMLFDVNFVFGFIVNGFRDGNYLLSILTILYIILTLTWFVLNIIRAKIYKVKKGENQ